MKKQQESFHNEFDDVETRHEVLQGGNLRLIAGAKWFSGNDDKCRLRTSGALASRAFCRSFSLEQKAAQKFFAV